MPGIHDEPVEVVRRGAAPEQFLLRARLYVVREVLARWVEPSRWRWAAPVQAYAGASAPVGGSAGGGSAGSGPGGWQVPDVLPRRQPAGRSAVVGAADREVWRVAAAAGRNSAVLVFDLCHDREESRWLATRVEEDQL
ncbi:MAG TPA: DUF6504 family protein [Mycobacteriales bacterium]|nr:DUF6504 family protein [Mycobacteriales bacterium]